MSQNPLVRAACSFTEDRATICRNGAGWSWPTRDAESQRPVALTRMDLVHRSRFGATTHLLTQVEVMWLEYVSVVPARARSLQWSVYDISLYCYVSHTELLLYLRCSVHWWERPDVSRSKQSVTYCRYVLRGAGGGSLACLLQESGHSRGQASTAGFR